MPTTKGGVFQWKTPKKFRSKITERIAENSKASNVTFLWKKARLFWIPTISINDRSPSNNNAIRIERYIKFYYLILCVPVCNYHVRLLSVWGEIIRPRNIIFNVKKYVLHYACMDPFDASLIPQKTRSLIVVDYKKIMYVSPVQKNVW